LRSQEASCKQTESEIRKLAREMGISTEGKSDEQLIEGIKGA
jgi:hypothetical protein